MTTKTILCFVVFLIAKVVHANHNDSNRQIFDSPSGQRCVTTEGRYGVCQSFRKDCPTAENNNDLEVCRSSLFDTLVCCPDPGISTTSSRPIKNPPKASEICGKSRVQKQNYIVNGTEPSPHSLPWMTALYQVSSGRRSFICGGAVLNENYILTAAHCVVRGSSTLPAKNFNVKLGAHRLSSSGEFYEISQVTAHEKYDSSHHKYDLALLKLKNPINWSSNPDIKPICLPTPEMDNLDLVGKPSIVAGWGTTRSDGGRPSDVLLYAEVPVVSNSECKSAYSTLLSYDDQINPTHICAGYKQGGRDSCQGDSGGPLFYDYQGSLYQIGIVSFGKGCAEPRYPGVYTRVTKYIDWLGQHMD